jgi:hypothetical protein
VAQQHPPIKINQNLTKTFFTQEANFSSYLSPKKKTQNPIQTFSKLGHPE